MNDLSSYHQTEHEVKRLKLFAAKFEEKPGKGEQKINTEELFILEERNSGVSWDSQWDLCEFFNRRS